MVNPHPLVEDQPHSIDALDVDSSWKTTLGILVKIAKFLTDWRREFVWVAESSTYLDL